jgi:hypothetical protein
VALERDLLLREQLKGLRQWLSQGAVLIVKSQVDEQRILRNTVKR